MNGWAVGTTAAIWTLIAGSLAVFGWFLVEVGRLARGRRNGAAPRGGPRDAAPDQDSSTRSSSIDDR